MKNISDTWQHVFGQWDTNNQDHVIIFLAVDPCDTSKWERTYHGISQGTLFPLITMWHPILERAYSCMWKGQ